jgi:hypothetical protein
MTYSEKLRDPRWQRKRLEIMNRDDFRCQACRSKDKTLNVHHRLYQKGNDPWDYENEMLVTLCEDCHKKIEDSIRMVAEKCAFDEDMVKIMNHLGSANDLPFYSVINQWIDSQLEFQKSPSVSNFNELQTSALRIIGHVTSYIADSSLTVAWEDEEGAQD